MAKRTISQPRARYYASWIYSAAYTLFLFGVFLFGPETLPPYKYFLLKSIVPLAAFPIGYFATGALKHKFKITLCFAKIKGNASGGFALVVFIAILCFFTPLFPDKETVQEIIKAKDDIISKIDGDIIPRLEELRLIANNSKPLPPDLIDTINHIPDNAGPYGAALKAIANKNYADAKENITEARKQNLITPHQANIVRGLIEHAQGNYQQAAEFYEKAVSLQAEKTVRVTDDDDKDDAATPTPETNLNPSIEQPQMDNGDRVIVQHTPTQENKSLNLKTIVIDLPNLPPGAKPLEMVLIPTGEFWMGSPEEEQDRIEWEGPRHPVKIAYEFYMGKYEITQAQWEAIMGENPSNNKSKPNNPVETVSWDMCKQFIEKLNSNRQGTFRLPSEAEREYACRAGTQTRFYWGDDPEYKQVEEYAWVYPYNPDKSMTHEVALKKPNAYGLYDMIGNVWEWCEDDWHNNYEGAPNDGRAWIDSPRGSSRVVRGGCWFHFANDCRSARRDRDWPGARLFLIGFRVIFSRT